MSRSSTSSSERFASRLTAGAARRLGLGAIVALGVVAVAELAVHVVRGPKGLPFESTRTGTLVEVAVGPDAPRDLLFLGSSQCAGAVDPASVADQFRLETTWSPDALNLGQPGARLLDVEALGGTVLPRLRPRHVVLLVGPGMATATETPELARAYGLDWLNGRLAPPHDALMSSWLFRYRRQWRDPRWQFYALRSGSPDGDLARRAGPDGRGWLPSGEGFGVMAPTVDPWRGGGPDPAWVAWQVPAEAIAATSRLLATARASGARTVIVIPPMAPRAERAYGDLDALFAKLRAGLENAAAETGTPVLDLHRVPGIDDAAFFDHHHLWAADARRFSRALASELVRSGAIAP